MNSNTMTVAERNRPEMTALAAFHISASPCDRSFSLKSGMNAAVNAPSPSSRRNRFGIISAVLNAPATTLSPMKFA
jgi:hypothetical protein